MPPLDTTDPWSRLKEREAIPLPAPTTEPQSSEESYYLLKPRAPEPGEKARPKPGPKPKPKPKPLPPLDTTDPWTGLKEREAAPLPEPTAAPQPGERVPIKPGPKPKPKPKPKPIDTVYPEKRAPEPTAEPEPLLLT